MTVSRAHKRGAPKMGRATRNGRVRINGRLKSYTRNNPIEPPREGMIYIARFLDERGRDVRPTGLNDNVAGLALQHGRYETVDSIYRQSVIETALTPCIINRTVTVIDGWIDEDVFDRRHVRVIEYARDLWRDIRFPRHPYFDPPDLEDRNDSFESERAKRLLHRCRRLVGESRWNIFENVVRWNEPTGIPGSRIANVSSASIAAAQEIVRGVADQVRQIL